MRPELQEMINATFERAPRVGIYLTDDLKQKTRTVLEVMDEERLGRMPIQSVFITESYSRIGILGQRPVSPENHDVLGDYSAGIDRVAKWPIPNWETDKPSREQMRHFRDAFLGILPEDRELRSIVSDRYSRYGLRSLITVAEEQFSGRNRILAHIKVLLWWTGFDFNERSRAFVQEFRLYQECAILKELIEGVLNPERRFGGSYDKLIA
jgi:hypothetical protein